MGQKVHPYGFRLGYNKTWKSRWFAKKDYAKFLHEDLKLKKRLKEQLQAAGVASIEVERPGNKLRITIHTARPGIIIGRKGAEIDRLRQEIQKRTGREVLPINIQEVHRPELNAQLVVSKAYVNEGPRSKRIRPAPMGRAFRFQRRMSHITVVVEAPEK